MRAWSSWCATSWYAMEALDLSVKFSNRKCQSTFQYWSQAQLWLRTLESWWEWQSKRWSRSSNSASNKLLQRKQCQSNQSRHCLRSTCQRATPRHQHALVSSQYRKKATKKRVRRMKRRNFSLNLSTQLSKETMKKARICLMIRVQTSQQDLQQW